MNSSTKQAPALSAATVCKFFDWQRTFKLALSKEMVKITVGADKDVQEFLVHAELITHCRPRLFNDVRMSKMGNEMLKGYFDVYQPLHPDVFIGLLQFAYHGKFFPETSLNTMWHFTYKNNKLLSFPDSGHMQLGYENTRKNSAARKFLTMCYAHLFDRNTKFPAHPICYNEMLASVAKNVDGLLLDTLNLMKWNGIIYDAEFDPRDVSPCHYHQHARGAKCPNFREMA